MKPCAHCQTPEAVQIRFCKVCACDTERAKSGRCKPCTSRYMRDRYIENRERITEQKNAYRRENQDKVKAAKKEWRLANLERSKATIKAWHKANPEASRTYHANRRALKKNAEGSHSREDIQKLAALQKNKCAVCKTCIKQDRHIDHVMPLLLGGSNYPSNLQLLCPSCNLQKKAKHPVDFMQQKGYLL